MIVLNWIRLQNHMAQYKANFDLNGLPRGLLNIAEKFSGAFHPVGLQPQVEEALHVLGILSTRQNYTTMQDHNAKLATALLLSAQKLYFDLTDQTRQVTLQYLEPKLLQTLQQDQVEALWTVLQTPIHQHIYSAPTLSLGISAKADKLSVPYKVALVDTTSMVPTLTSTLDGRGTPTEAGAVDQRSVGPSASQLLRTGTTTERTGLHRTPSHTQGADPFISGTGTQTSQGQPGAILNDAQTGVEVRGAPPVSERTNPSVRLPNSQRPQSPPEFGRAPGHSNPSIQPTPNPYPPPQVELTTDPDYIFKIVTETGLTRPAYNLSPAWKKTYRSKASQIQRHIDTGRTNKGQLPDLIGDHMGLHAVKQFLLEHNTTYWAQAKYPVDQNLISSSYKINNGVRLVAGSTDPGSNFFEADILYRGIQHRSPEHAIVFNKLLACGVTLPNLGKYYKNPNLVTDYEVDLRRPAHIKWFGNVILNHEKRSIKPWRDICLLIVAEILLERAFTNIDFLNVIMNPEASYFLHQLENSSDDYWAGESNYHGKLLQFTREVIVSTVSHAACSGTTGYYGPLAQYLPSHILQQYQTNPGTGVTSYNIEVDTTNVSNKIRKQPHASLLNKRFLSTNYQRGQLPRGWAPGPNTYLPPGWTPDTNEFPRLSEDAEINYLIHNPQHMQELDDADWTNSQRERNTAPGNPEARNQRNDPEYLRQLEQEIMDWDPPAQTPAGPTPPPPAPAPALPRTPPTPAPRKRKAKPSPPKEQSGRTTRANPGIVIRNSFSALEVEDTPPSSPEQTQDSRPKKARKTEKRQRRKSTSALEKECTSLMHYINAKHATTPGQGTQPMTSAASAYAYSSSSQERPKSPPRPPPTSPELFTSPEPEAHQNGQTNTLAFFQDHAQQQNQNPTPNDSGLGEVSQNLGDTTIPTPTTGPENEGTTTQPTEQPPTPDTETPQVEPITTNQQTAPTQLNPPTPQVQGVPPVTLPNGSQADNKLQTTPENNTADDNGLERTTGGDDGPERNSQNDTSARGTPGDPPQTPTSTQGPTHTPMDTSQPEGDGAPPPNMGAPPPERTPTYGTDATKPNPVRRLDWTDSPPQESPSTKRKAQQLPSPELQAAPTNKAPRPTSPPRSPQQPLKKSTERKATPGSKKIKSTLTPGPTPNSTNIHRFNHPMFNDKESSAPKLVLADEALNHVTTYKNNDVEIHIMVNLNPESLNSLLVKRTTAKSENNNLTDVYIIMGHRDVRRARDISTYKEKMGENIRLLKLMAPNATIHIFKLSVDNKWVSEEKLRAYNQTLISVAGTSKVKIVKLDETWHFITNTEDTLVPVNEASTKNFLADTLKAPFNRSGGGATTGPSKNLMRRRGHSPDPQSQF